MPIEIINRNGDGNFALINTGAGGGGFDIIQVSAYVPPPPSATPSVSVTPSVTVSITPSVTAVSYTHLTLPTKRIV